MRVVDFGIRGLDLTYALLDGYEAVILVDAAPRGGPPGTLYVMEPTADATRAEEAEGGLLVEAHGMDPVKVLRLAAAMGGRVGRLLLVGCEPAPARRADDMRAGLSDRSGRPSTRRSPSIESLVARLLRGEAIEASGDGIIPRRRSEHVETDIRASRVLSRLAGGVAGGASPRGARSRSGRTRAGWSRGSSSVGLGPAGLDLPRPRRRRYMKIHSM